ncbi:cytochrome b/b6 domain-containing protein [Sinomonas sp. P10A9]|uniref:Cytochrome b/b6 domain-containing protein n=1 Tax=Sinomonas puerhi TaxID=3238584 RepID=A0AB39L7W1_9MICC
MVRFAVLAVTAVAALAVLVLAARWLIGLPPVARFVAEHPGQAPLPPSVPVGIPAWLGWQHFFNAFLMLLIVRTGWQVRTTTRPTASWTRKNTGLLRTKGQPKKISLELWFHLSLDALWVLNGLVFAILLFVTGQWMRIVPTSWEIVPHAASALLQYAALEWPLENGWVSYNALQVLAYFVTVFIAAPLSVLTGVRMSNAWPKGPDGINRLFPIELARRLHFPVMIYFVAFTAVHVFLVFATGALRNLNHMYAPSDDDEWLGFAFFSASLVVMIAAWFLARPLFLRPIAALMGKVGR